MEKETISYKKFMEAGRKLAKEIPHDLFVHGVKNGRITYEIFLKNQYKLLNKSHKIAFSIYCIMYMVVPLIALTIFSYVRGNWYILIGIAVSYLGSFLGAKGSKLPFLLTLAGLGWWIASGFHMKSYQMFYLVCLWWGYMWFHIANSAETEYAKQELITNPDLYKKLAENDVLLIMIKPNSL